MILELQKQLQEYKRMLLAHVMRMYGMKKQLGLLVDTFIGKYDTPYNKVTTDDDDTFHRLEVHF